VTVENQSGTTIAVGTLAGNTGGGVSYVDTVTVPTETFYEIVIGGVPGSTTFSNAQLAENNWTAALTYGS
jgi:hypothetical protein